MDAWSGIIAAEWATFALLGAYALAERARQRAAMRWLALYAFTRNPTVDPAPPTTAEILGPDEWVLPRRTADADS